MESSSPFNEGWCEESKYFWMGANGCEYIAYKGSHQVFVYPTWEYPKPPESVMQYHKRIETNDDFFDAINNSTLLKATYTVVEEVTSETITDEVSME